LAGRHQHRPVRRQQPELPPSTPPTALASHFRFTQGPTLVTHLALAGLEPDGSYSMAATTRGYDDHQADARRHLNTPEPKQLEHLQHHRRGITRPATTTSRPSPTPRSRTRPTTSPGEFRLNF
jgi:hypothetical protein